jgi:hypothetical protein
MAVAGSARAEIIEALRSDYGLADPSPIVDDILGSED